jgi:nucleoside 2-deoxyribosyltransferase
MKIYLAGPMRGKPNFNFPAFDYAAAKLREQGHEVFSPADHDREQNGPEIEINPTGDEAICEKQFGFSIRDALGADLTWICREADAVALLPGWEHSTGATAERATAIALGLSTIILGREYLNADH